MSSPEPYVVFADLQILRSHAPDIDDHHNGYSHRPDQPGLNGL